MLPWPRVGGALSGALKGSIEGAGARVKLAVGLIGHPVCGASAAATLRIAFSTGNAGPAVRAITPVFMDEYGTYTRIRSLRSLGPAAVSSTTPTTTSAAEPERCDVAMARRRPSGLASPHSRRARSLPMITLSNDGARAASSAECAYSPVSKSRPRTIGMSNALKYPAARPSGSSSWQDRT